VGVLNDFPSHILCIVDHCSLGSKKCICYYYETRLSQTCKDIEEQRVLLRKQCEEAENLLNSNDTRRFIGAENSIIVKALQSVIQYQTPSNIKRAYNFVFIDFIEFENELQLY
jgi:hypothetical protein